MLKGQVALVTGAGSGLGRQFAQVLARNGAAVGVAGRRQSRCDEVVAEIEREGGTAMTVPLDVTDSNQIVTAVDRISTAYGTPTILVNNAGIPDGRRAHKMPLELVDAVLQTNLRGPWLLATEVGRRLIAERISGRIVNISSIESFTSGVKGAALYSVTKAAVNRLTEVLAYEWSAYGINVNAIAPGAFASEMMSGVLDRMGDITEGFPRRRLPDPNELDSTLLYLVSPHSTAVTGTIIKVDDGQWPR